MVTRLSRPGYFARDFFVGMEGEKMGTIYVAGSLNMDLTAMVMKGIITKEMAIARSNNPKELNLF